MLKLFKRSVGGGEQAFRMLTSPRAPCFSVQPARPGKWGPVFHSVWAMEEKALFMNPTSWNSLGVCNMPFLPDQVRQADIMR